MSHDDDVHLRFARLPSASSKSSLSSASCPSDGQLVTAHSTAVVATTTSSSTYKAPVIADNELQCTLDSLQVKHEAILNRIAELETLRGHDEDPRVMWEHAWMHEQLEHTRRQEKVVLDEAYGSDTLPVTDVRIQLELLGLKSVSDEFVQDFRRELLLYIKHPEKIYDGHRGSRSDSALDLFGMSRPLISSFFRVNDVSVTRFPLPLVAVSSSSLRLCDGNSEPLHG